MNTLRTIAICILLACALSTVAQPGQLVTSFGNGGVLTLPLSSMMYCADLQTDGKIVLGGAPHVGGDSCYLIRLSPDGIPDPAFDGDGRVGYSFNIGAEFAADLVVQQDGKIAAFIGSFSEAFLIRLHPDGSLDETFGDGGVVTIAAPGHDIWPLRLALTPDGGYLTSMSWDELWQMRKFTSDGFVDTGFGSNGVVASSTNIESAFAPTGLSIDPSSRILVCYSEMEVPNSIGIIQRYSSDGIPDNTFGSNGTLSLDLPSALEHTWDIIPQGSNAMLVSGNSGTGSSQSGFIIKLDGSGDPDPSFGDNGLAYFPVITDTIYELHRMLIQPDGAIVLSGYISVSGNDVRDVALLRFTAEGVLDLQFGSAGLSLIDIPGNSQGGRDAMLLSDLTMVVVGAYTDGLWPTGVLMKIATGLHVGITEEGALGPSSAIHPIPMHDRGVLQVEENEAGPLQVSLIDANGRELGAVGRSGALQQVEQAIELELPKGLSPGPYLLRIASSTTTRSQMILVE